MALRIQFFGSDLFSIKSLASVCRLARSSPEIIEKLQVVCRVPKPSGRGQTKIVDLPIMDFARRNNLEVFNVEEKDEFADLLLPGNGPNLAIAVSYGKLIPAFYLKSLKYGGLNVHPSLLPSFRGAAPLQRAIMAQVPYTGVSVQTLHPTKFDRGKILWQQPVALEPSTTYPELRDQLGDLGAAGLFQVLREKLYLGDGITSPYPPSWASIIRKDEHRISTTNTADKELAKGHALGKLFFEQQLIKRKKNPRIVRIILSSFTIIDHTDDLPPGTLKQFGDMLGVKCADKYLGARRALVEGFKEESALEYFEKRDTRGLKQIVT